MQYLKLDYELITDTKITSNEFRIYTYLLSRYNKEVEGAFPSYETIATKLNIGIATVKRSVKNLVSYGYMVIEKAKSVKGNYNVYKKLKHLIQDHQEPKKEADKLLEGQISVDEVPTVKYDSYKTPRYTNNKKVLKFNNYEQRTETVDEDYIMGWD